MQGQPDVQRRKIQDHDLPDWGNSHMDVRGGLHLEEHWGECHLLGSPMVTHPMSGLRGGLDGRAHDGPFQMIAWNKAVN